MRVLYGLFYLWGPAKQMANFSQIGSFVGALVIALQFPASNVAGYTKRTTGTAFVFLAYCIGNIIGEHFDSSGRDTFHGPMS